MIERFCHLKIELDRFGITKTREEIIDKITEALPRIDQWQTFVFILKNDVLYDTITLDALIEKIESHELELQKQSKVSNSSYQQNVGLYYRGSVPLVSVNESPKTAFSVEKSKDSQKSSSSYNPGYHSSSTASNSEEPDEILCNIALKLKNSPTMSINAAKQQMSFLASILESYESLVAGRIGNPELTKEDYNQIDPLEMELIDIRRVTHADEGFNWNDYLDDDDDDDETALVAEIKESAFVAVVKERSKEEILKEKTYRERCVVDYRIQEMGKEYEEARNYRRWDKKRECYINSKGEPLVHPSKVVYNDVLAVIPLSGEYYVKKLDKIIRDVMTARLRQRDEEDEEEYKVEVEKEEAAGEEEQKPVEEAVTEKQLNEDDLKKEEKVNEKLERSVEVVDADDAAEEQQKKEVDQKQTREKAEVPTTEQQYEIKQQVVNSYIEDVAELKRKRADLEQDNNKLHRYHASSYVLERIFNIKPDDNDSEKNKKGIGSEYHQVPPPFEKKIHIL
ncbi:uncharacterized protein LOC110887577 [Helianthus annuus]|uniref:uncharacterized protein LOC110887577 n=1 Tax=Helianthus annuus TaxID=4232 RepID=UPI000B8FC78A|nr:uncharacterized protein LOC110887577 [Helianthus annuus]